MQASVAQQTQKKKAVFTRNSGDVRLLFVSAWRGHTVSHSHAKRESRRAEERRKRGQSDAEQLEVARLVLARHGREHWPLVVVTGSAWHVREEWEVTVAWKCQGYR